MIFRQLFDSVSSTYSYLIAARHGGEAVIIDPVLERVDRYVELLRELDLRLVRAIDTHLHADHIPGHTDDSYSYRLDDRVFTGDTLLIRGTGRTDFQNGDARAQYDSIFRRLLCLADDTLVFPAHDYRGETVTTIGEERRHNPRLQVASADEYVALMAGLKLPNPKMWRSPPIGGSGCRRRMSC
jgi:glyoxylase-like metal-dependent hydrolase (beta-lactamase superfamily II)